MQKSISPNDYRLALGTAIRACRRGREILLERFGRLEHIEKKHMAGLVSEADKLSEEAIIRVLREDFPHSEILGEESNAAGAPMPASRAGSNGRWIIDPLDGTTNYIHRFPIYCISIGLEVDGVVVVGVIDVPALGETYTAIRGQGAFVNGRPLRGNDSGDFSKSVLATGFFPEDKANLAEQLKLFSNVVGDVRGVRRAGAAAFDLCMVAAGVFDAFWEKGLKPWDVAAGQLLVEETGGVVRKYDGGDWDPYCGTIVAGNPAIVSELNRRFKSVLG